MKRDISFIEWIFIAIIAYMAWRLFWWLLKSLLKELGIWKDKPLKTYYESLTPDQKADHDAMLARHEAARQVRARNVAALIAGEQDEGEIWAHGDYRDVRRDDKGKLYYMKDGANKRYVKPEEMFDDPPLEWRQAQREKRTAALARRRRR